MLDRLKTRIIGSILLWDLLITLACLHIASTIRLTLDFGLDITQAYVVLPWTIYAMVTILWTVMFLLLNPQRTLFTATLLHAISRLIGAIGLAAISFAGVLYLSFRDVSRLQFFYFVFIDLCILLVFHLGVRFFINVRSQRSWRRTALVVGDPATAVRLADEFERRPWASIIIAGYTNDQHDASVSVPCLGTINETPRLVTEKQIDEVIFALPAQQHEQVVRLSLALARLPVMVHMIPSVLDLAFARTQIENLGGIPLISLRESALTDAQRLLKRMFDLCATALLLLMLSPALLLIALMIKIESPGSIFFLQERIGEQGRRFRMIKFRSMYQDADKRWHEVVRRNNDGHLIHKSNDDPRVTRIGRKLRRTSLDELPQLFNVLKGEMSLVGPRPEMPYIAAEYEPWQWQRFRVPPGMTGWWQINGRSEKPMHLHTEDDLYYIQNYSFWLDLRILTKTISVVWQGQGAF